MAEKPTSGMGKQSNYKGMQTNGKSTVQSSDYVQDRRKSKGKS